MKKIRLIILGALSLLMMTGAAQAGPMLFAGNGHYYDVIYSTGPISQADALAAAAASTNLGQTGYLATITSAAEQSFITNLLDDFNAWIGLGDAATEGTYLWLDGPEAGTDTTATYQNWVANGINIEPNDPDGNEDAVFLAANPGILGYAGGVGRWLDINGSGQVFSSNGSEIEQARVAGYVVEYATVPEPSIIALFGLGLLGMGFARRRKA